MDGKRKDLLITLFILWCFVLGTVMVINGLVGITEAERGFQQVIIDAGVWIKQIVDAVEAG